METVFNLRFRFIDKNQNGNDRAPDKSLVIDFTPEEAKKMARYLLDKATETELGNDSTIRKYSGREYSEVPGFTIWGSFWSGSNSGAIAPQIK